MDWILKQENQGYFLLRARAREMATRIPCPHNYNKHLGFYLSFKILKSKPSIPNVIKHEIEAFWINGNLQDAIQRIYDVFKQLEADFKVRREYICNLDERGIGLSV